MQTFMSDTRQVHRLCSRSLPSTYLNKDLVLEVNHKHDALYISMGRHPGHGLHVWLWTHCSGRGHASTAAEANTGQAPLLLPAPCEAPDQHPDGQRHDICCAILFLDSRVLQFEQRKARASDPELHIMVQLTDQLSIIVIVPFDIRPLLYPERAGISECGAFVGHHYHIDT